jgi:hypothetical protein
MSVIQIIDEIKFDLNICELSERLGTIEYKHTQIKKLVEIIKKIRSDEC